MADSVFPPVRNWWLSRGSRRVGGIYVPVNSSASPTDTSAQPRGAGKYTIDLTYTSGVNVMAISIVWYDDAGKRQAVSRMPTLIDIPAGNRAPLRIDVELPPSQWAKWVPVLEIPAKGGHDILIHAVNIYPAQPPEPEASVFTWPGQWWTNTGKQSGTDLTVPSGGIFVPWATRATPVKSGNWEVVFTYTSASPSRVSVAHNKFKEADETRQTGQSRIGDFDLPAGSSVVKAVRFTIPTEPDPLWTPQFQMPAGSPDVTFHKIEVHEYTPDPNAEPPAKTGGVEVHGEGSAQVWVHEAPQDVPAQMRAMPSGYPSIDAMVAQKGFLVAHRGGSASWPEMSMRAYTNSVAHGAGALEVSAGRTSDGVWVLAHDQNLQRVDPSAPTTPIAQMTWAEVQRYRTAGEKILRIEEYLEAYGRSHITVLDPKYSAAQWADLARLLPADAKSRVIWKSAGDATWLAAQWKAAGWRCWGYAYAQHASDGSLSKWAPSWDYLGFPWDAPALAWKVATSFGKPVWAHICPTKAAYDQGLQNGAVGCMVSGVADVLKTPLV
jgi:putative glycerophosphodiester phosphodiesterase